MRRVIGSLAAALGVCLFLAVLLLALDRQTVTAQTVARPAPFALTLREPGGPFTFANMRRATVEFVSGQCEVVGQLKSVVLTFRAEPRSGDPRNANHNLVPVLVGTEGSTNYYSFAQSMTAYGGNATVLDLVVTPTAGSVASCSAAVAGFWEAFGS